MNTLLFQLAVAEAILRKTGSPALRQEAARLVEEGSRSSSLIRLSQANVSGDELANLLGTSLKELGITLPTKRQALLALSKNLARRLLSGELSAVDAAERIWRFSIEVPDQVPESSTFIYAALEADGRPPHELAKFEEGILAAARDLIEAPPDDSNW